MAHDSQRRTGLALADLLDRLEEAHGRQEPNWPVVPYDFILWWNCGYPPSDAACAKGWKQISDVIGTRPQALLDARPRSLAAALKAGGMVPEVRAERVQEIARRVRDDYGGDLSAALGTAAAPARKILKTFPGIADPGADRILLFARIAALALPFRPIARRCLFESFTARRGPDYGANYRLAQQAVEDGVPTTYAARSRAYLLLKRHGQEICKRVNPRCEACTLRSVCAYYRQVRSSKD